MLLSTFMLHDFSYSSLSRISLFQLTLAAHYLLAQIYMTDSFPDEDVETPDRNFDEYYIHDDGSDYPDIEKVTLQNCINNLGESVIFRS